jgi:hypothetical protein
VTFSGTITVDGPGTVSYRWEHSPGTGILKQITFAQAGTQTVYQTYTKGSDDFLELFTVTPNSMGAHASFTVQCLDLPDLTVAPHSTPPLSLPRSKTPAHPQRLTLPGLIRALKVDVINIGSKAYTPPPVARVTARNLQGKLIGTANLSAAIPPNGGRTTMTIPITGHQPFDPSHEGFRATVDDQQVVTELREDNNSVGVRPPAP